MDKNTENYLRGSMGDPSYTSMVGQIGYNNYEQKQEREKARYRKLVEDAERSSGSSGNGSMKELILFALALVAVETYMNFTGYLVSDFQRIAAFIGAVASFAVVHLYWDLIVKVAIGLFVIFVGGSFGYDAILGN